MILAHIMDETEKEAVSAWKYEGAYGLYNLPPYEVQKERGTAFTDPERAKNYYAYYEGSVLIGFTNLSEGAREVSVGIGVRPSLCGRGYGPRILLRAAELARELYPGKPLSLEVRTWNRRAVRCYEKAGFQIDGVPFKRSTPIGTGLFYRMVRDGPE